MNRYLLLLSLAATLLLGGCGGTAKLQQHFIAEDAETGERAIYKVELAATGTVGVVYNLQAAYLPATAVDLYSGKVPKTLAELDALSTAKDGSVTSRIIGDFQEILKEQSSRRKQDAAGERIRKADDLQALTEYYSRLVAASAYRLSDLQSIGEQGSAMPHRFRKLTFFATTSVVKVSDFQDQTQALQDGIDGLGTSLARVAAARRAEQEQQAKARQIAPALVSGTEILLGFVAANKAQQDKLSNEQYMELATLLGRLQ